VRTRDPARWASNRALSAVSLGLGLLEEVLPGVLGCQELIGVLPPELTQAGFQERQPLAVLVGTASFVGEARIPRVVSASRAVSSAPGRRRVKAAGTPRAVAMCAAAGATRTGGFPNSGFKSPQQ
jgi:hypothetical protein